MCYVCFLWLCISLLPLLFPFFFCTHRRVYTLHTNTESSIDRFNSDCGAHLQCSWRGKRNSQCKCLNYLPILVDAVVDKSIFVRDRSAILVFWLRQLTMLSYWIFNEIINGIRITLPPARHFCDTPKLLMYFRIWCSERACVDIWLQYCQ